MGSERSAGVTRLAQAAPLDATRQQVALFEEILRAAEPSISPESNDLLQELRNGLTRAQQDLQNRICVESHDENSVMEWLAVNDLIDTAFAAFQAAVSTYDRLKLHEHRKDVPNVDNEEVNTLENELRDLFEAPTAPTTTAPP